MKLSPLEQESLIRLMIRLYDELMGIESEFQLYTGGGDMRPRIDYFHDAIRAFTSGSNTQRLSIEQLAYDVAALRYIYTMPLAAFKPGGDYQSPAAGIVQIAPGLVPKSKQPDRETKLRITELYQQYAVLFAALLKPNAENDYHERTEQTNDDIKHISQMVQALASNANAQVIATLANHLEDDQTRQMLDEFIQKGGSKNKDALKKIINHLKQNIQNKDKEVKTIDAAHHQYATSQLAVYESSKDMLKKLAANGMNIVGQFVEASIRNNTQGRGR